MTLRGRRDFFRQEITPKFLPRQKKKNPFTVHAGEAGGAEDVILAVKAGASRIGHGVRAAQSEKAVKLLRDSGVTLEMCPTSNRLTGACDMKNYPLRFFAETGVRGHGEHRRPGHRKNKHKTGI